MSAWSGLTATTERHRYFSGVEVPRTIRVRGSSLEREDYVDNLRAVARLLDIADLAAAAIGNA